MTTHLRTFYRLLFVGLLGACSSSVAPLRDAAVDAFVDRDSQNQPADLAAHADFPAEGAIPTAALGTISGSCGILTPTVWNDDSPALFRNRLDLGSAEFDAANLSSGGQEVLDDGNRGGNSLHSEAIAYEMLFYCEAAKLLKTETEIAYLEATGKKSDLLLEIDQRKIGVSVTRAYHYPPGDPYLPTEALTLLEKKVAALPDSRANAAAVDRWQRSVLHILAYDDQHADLIESAWTGLNAETKANSIVVITVTDGNDTFIY